MTVFLGLSRVLAHCRPIIALVALLVLINTSVPIASAFAAQSSRIRMAVLVRADGRAENVYPENQTNTTTPATCNTVGGPINVPYRRNTIQKLAWLQELKAPCFQPTYAEAEAPAS
jgi:hypothetical protein